MAYKRISPQPVPEGGTGAQSFTAYSVVCAGTTATGAFQNVVGVGNAGEILTSAGAAALPVWAASPAAGVVSITGDAGGAQTGAITLTGGTTGASYGGAAGTITMTFAGITVNGGDINLGTAAVDNAINVGTNANAGRTIEIGNLVAASQTNVRSGTGGMNLNSTSGTISMVSTSGDLFLSTTGTVNISNDAANNAINIATGAGAKTLTLGTTNTTASTTVQSGSTGISITSATANGPITIVSGTGTIGIATSATNSTVNVGTGGGVKACSFGSTNTTSSTTLQSGSGALNVTATGGALTINSGTGALSISNDASATTVNIATGGAVKTVVLGSTNTTSITTVNYGTGGYFLASATGNVMTALSSGEINYPLQPAFLAVLASPVLNATGDATTYTVAFDTEVFDQNGDFDGTSTFTAPVTGRYSFMIGGTFSEITAAYVDCFFSLVTSNRTYICERMNPSASFASGGFIGLQTTVLADMDSGDTATFAMNAGNSAKTVDIYAASSTNVYTYFSGHLAC